MRLVRVRAGSQESWKAEGGRHAGKDKTIKLLRKLTRIEIAAQVELVAQTRHNMGLIEARRTIEVVRFTELTCILQIIANDRLGQKGESRVAPAKSRTSRTS